MKRNQRRLLWIAGTGVGAYLAYRYVYQPWAAQRALAATGGGAAGLPGATGAGGVSLYPQPLLPGLSSILAPVQDIVPITSIGPQYGGVLGACIQRKGGSWSAEKCSTRLTQLVDAFNTAKAQVAALKSAAANPAAAGIPAAQAQLAASQAALVNATAGYNRDMAAGDTAGAAKWMAAIQGQQSDINALQARIATAGQAVDNTAGIAAYQGAMAAHDADYFNLTGVHLLAA